MSGANEFFHLSSSQAAEHQIPAEFLAPTVRRGKFLTGDVIDDEKFSAWKVADEACTLLLIPPTRELPEAITRYLDSERGLEARRSYKCRIRPFWYSVPGVIRPDYFLQYMAGSEVWLARNDAAAACTNSIHAVQITDVQKAASALPQWTSALTKLSCELEGHPLGGGMLKLEPREASRLLFEPACGPTELFRDAIEVMRQWRHSAT
ncbi:hypothetical protein ACU8KI_16660 [Rhizobium leguminosarum]